MEQLVNLTTNSNYELLKKSRMSQSIIVALFSVTLVFGPSTIGFTNSPLQQQEVYAQEILPEICDNLIDDDNNGLIDYEESCSPPAVEGEEALPVDEFVPPETAMTPQVEICGNLFDDDGDTFVDIEDPESCIPVEGAENMTTADTTTTGENIDYRRKYDYGRYYDYDRYYDYRRKYDYPY